MAKKMRALSIRQPYAEQIIRANAAQAPQTAETG
jgi:hypothetical protein